MGYLKNVLMFDESKLIQCNYLHRFVINGTVLMYLSFQCTFVVEGGRGWHIGRSYIYMCVLYELNVIGLASVLPTHNTFIMPNAFFHQGSVIW